MIDGGGWFARAARAGFVLGVIALAPACGGDHDDGDGRPGADPGPDPGGGAGDGDGTWPTGPREPDAAPDDRERIPSDDEVCAALCPLTYACADSAPDPRCEPGCSWDLWDCADDEVATLAACADVPCEQLAGCIAAVGCVDRDWLCGDGECSSDETCATCPGDCACVCGDGVCSAGEDCETCPYDCGPCFCGDGLCSPGECDDCGADCPGGCVCPHDECSLGDPLDPGCGDCVASVCDLRASCCAASWDARCVAEAEDACGLACPPVCGDLSCEAGENRANCPQDCPVRCGDSVCTDSETCDFCSEDCGECACGDGACTIGECGACEADCPGCSCPHDVCTLGEPLDRNCGLCEWRVCSSYGPCCTEEWDDLCVFIAGFACEADCPPPAP